MRRTVFATLAGLVVGAMLMAAVPGGAVGQSFLLGQKNTEKVVTRLNTRDGLRVDSFKSGNPPLILNTTDVLTPPMQLNSHAKVDMLNADYVDGWSGSDLHTGHFWCSNDNIPGGANFDCSQMFQVPTGGATVYMSGSVDMEGHASASTEVLCSFIWTDASDHVIAESVRYVTVDAGEMAVCSSDAIKELPAGYYGVKFHLENPGGAVDPGRATAWWLMLP